MNKKILELKNINLSYDNKKTYVLKNISFGVYSGEILSIIGMNGSGKSSLLKIIAGITKPSSGKITKDYKKMSYVPQKINIDESFPISVFEFIKIYNKGVEKKEVIFFLEKMGAPDLIDKKINNLSGGQMQKVLIISSIINKPDIVLLDEPTAGIDVIGEEIFYENIKEIKQILPSIAIILVSHNIKLVYKNSNKVICLHENNFCCHGTPLEIQENQTIKSIFGEYVLPYEHHPHSHEKHKH